MYQIGIVWSGIINNKNYIESQGIIVYDNVKMSQSLNCVYKLREKNIKVIIVTAGIYWEIFDKVSEHLVVAYSSYIDIIETLRIIENQHGVINQKIALVIHESHEYNMKIFSKYTNNDLSLFTFKKAKDLHGIFDILYSKSYNYCICGPTAAAIAKEFNIRSFPMPFNDNTLLRAIKRAEQIIDFNKHEYMVIKKLQMLLDDLPDNILICTQEGIIEDCNSQARKMFNVTIDEIIGKNITNLLPELSLSNSTAREIITNKEDKYFAIVKHVLYTDTKRLIVQLTPVKEMDAAQNKLKKIQSLGLVANYHFEDVIYQSQIMKQVIAMSKSYANYDFTVLIEGETGTGKEMIAQSIHNESQRKKGPFVAVNCATLSEELLESELMGYEEGAFTGARKGGKIGLFEQANLGTIFLDEIHQMSIRLQAKLLRVLQERQITHIGGNRVIDIDVRIIAATNENIAELAEAGEFRSDLYYRINVLNIRMPSLKERKDDIEPLINHFVTLYNIKYDKNSKLNLNEILNYTLNYNWPGNIRELQNYVYKMIILSENNLLGELNKTIFSNENRNKITVSETNLEDMQKQIISIVLEQCNGNKSEAARRLGINRNTINNLLNS